MTLVPMRSAGGGAAAARLGLAIGLLAGGHAERTAAQPEWGGWHSVAVRHVDTPRVDITSFLQLRLHDGHREVRQVYVSGLFSVDAHPRLGLAANYTFLPTRVPAAGPFRQQHRLELEVNPRWSAGSRVQMEVRNRLELRRLEWRNGLNQRSRHRVQAVRTLEGGRLAAVFANNEFFYDWDGAGFNENRLTPAGVRVRLAGRATIDAYYMLLSVEAGPAWRHTHLVGSHLAVAW